MLTAENILQTDKDDLPEASKNLSLEDIASLISWLELKEDNIRYQAFQLLQYRSQFYDDVFPYWDNFRNKLKSDNSYQRSIGAMLIAENVRWDKGSKTEGMLEEYFGLLNDEKPITVRQSIQSLGKIVLIKPELNDKIAQRLIEIDLFKIKDTMRKSVFLDILNTLLNIRKTLKSEKIECYILNALSGEILDKKTKKLIEAQL